MIFQPPKLVHAASLLWLKSGFNRDHFLAARFDFKKKKTLVHLVNMIGAGLTASEWSDNNLISVVFVDIVKTHRTDRQSQNSQGVAIFIRWSEVFSLRSQGHHVLQI